MKGKNITIFGLGAIGGFIGGNVFAFYKMLHSKRNLTLCLFLVQ